MVGEALHSPAKQASPRTEGLSHITAHEQDRHWLWEKIAMHVALYNIAVYGVVVVVLLLELCLLLLVRTWLAG